MSMIPKIGEKYHFFDDGKLQNNRHYIAECVKILTPEEAQEAGIKKAIEILLKE